jgi:DNA polymerase-3 subunit alpha
VAQITTFGTMQARAVIRDVGRAIDMPYGEVDKIAKLIPAALNITLAEALAQEPRLRQLAEENEQVAGLIRSARALEGLTRHASTHAAGVVISDKPLTEYTPLYRGPRGEVLTQYDMESLERIGLVKFDFLSLKTLTVIDGTTRLVRQGPASELDLAKVPGDDKKTFDMLCDGNTSGVFQLEGRGITELVVKLKPERLEDIIAAIALYRPGPLQSGMADEFIERKHGRLPIGYELPQLKHILDDTYGVIVYQEQVMRIARELAGFTPQEADLLRYAMGKKVPEEMNRQKELFISGAKKRGIKQRKASRVFDLMAHFAGYGFNKSHSAAYAVISYHTAYLKAHYPLQFMSALLSSERDNSDKVMRYIAECRQKGLEVLPPDINESEEDFTVVGSKIRFGLAAVKNVGVGAIEAMLESRRSAGVFSSLADFCQRLDSRKVNRRVIESLIKAGAFDSLNKNRIMLLSRLKEEMEVAQASQRDREQGQFSLFADMGTKAAVTVEDPDDDVEASLDTNMAYEKEVLGLYLSDHPLRPYLDALKPLGASLIKDLPAKQDGTQVTLAGLVSNLKEKFTKKGQLMAFLTLEDLTGQLEVIVFSDLFKDISFLLGSGKPLVVQGVLDVAEEGVKLKATKVWPVSDPEPMRASTVSAHITIREESLAKELLLTMKEILKKNPGASPAYLHLMLRTGKEALIALEERVALSERLAQELNELLGDNAVAFTEQPEN